MFFTLLLDDVVGNYQAYYRTTVTLFLLHYVITVSLRVFFATYIIKQLRKRILGFNTLVIGNNSRTLTLVDELNNKTNAQGFLIKGFVSADNINANEHKLNNTLTFLKSY